MLYAADEMRSNIITTHIGLKYTRALKQTINAGMTCQSWGRHQNGGRKYEPN